MGVGTPILGVNIENSSVSTVFTTGFHGADGIAMDNDGRFYVSEWTNDTIYRYDNTFSSAPELFLSGLNDPADIYYDSFNNILAVPNFSSNTVDFVAITPTSIEDKQGGIPQNFKLHQNYPNPFNAETTIRFGLSQSSTISIKVYNIQGKLIRSITDGKIWSAGSHSITWNGKDENGFAVSSGEYFYKLETEGFCETKKMILLK